MERSEILELMGTLQLAGMRAAYDEIVAVGIKRQHAVEKIIGALLAAEIAAKNARSINYQMTIAKLPLAKELADLTFEGTPINGALIEQLSSGVFLADQRNVVLVGGTGTGKSHIAIGITRSIVRSGKKARFFRSPAPCPTPVWSLLCRGRGRDYGLDRKWGAAPYSGEGTGRLRQQARPYKHHLPVGRINFFRVANRRRDRHPSSEQGPPRSVGGGCV